MADETKHIGAEVDADTKAVLDQRLNHGELSEILREVAHEVAYGNGWDEATAIDMEIERLETELQQARQDRREVEARIETVEDDLAAARRRRERTQTTEEQLEAALVPLESDLRDGERIFSDLGSVVATARKFDLEPEDVVERLKERNPDVPDRAFRPRPSLNAGENWNGVPPEERKTPPGERKEAYR